MVVTSIFSFSLYVFTCLNPLPDIRILDMTKLKAFAGDKLNITRTMVSPLDRVENTVGKGENGYQHFLPFPQCFPNPFSLGSLKVGIVCVKDLNSFQFLVYIYFVVCKCFQFRLVLNFVVWKRVKPQWCC